MINLLPPDRADGIRYGRLNARMRTWLFGLALAIAGLLLILGGGSLYISQQSKSLQTGINSSQAQLAAQNLPAVQKSADQISGDVKVINQVLSREIDFSSLLQAMGKIMPSGTVLNSLTLTTTKGAIDLSASARDYNSAAQIAVNLGDPKNGLFDKVDVVSINCTTGATAYDCTATLKALFSKAAQTSFLSVAKKAGGS